jgi:putative transposase
VKGLGSSEKGNSWNYATATTKYNGKVLLLAFITQVNGMSKDEIVKALVEQVVSMGFKIRLITLDAGFYTVDVLNFISQFKYIIAVPAGVLRCIRSLTGITRLIVRGTRRTSRLSSDSLCTVRRRLGERGGALFTSLELLI